MQESKSSSRGVPVAVALLALGAVAWWLLRGGTDPQAGAPDQASAGGPAAADGAGLALDRPRLPDVRKSAQASISGTVRDRQGAPIAGATVCATLGWRERVAASDRRQLRCAQTGKDGHYRVEGLMPLRHLVQASAPGFIPGSHKPAGARSGLVALQAGAETRDVDIALEGGGVEIHGFVKDLSGGAVEGAWVHGEAGAMVLSGPEGQFSLWVRPGEVTVAAVADGYALAQEEGAAPGHLFEVYLTPESVIVGKVVRAGDGAPVADALVETQGEGMRGSGGSAFTDAGGNFRLDGLEPGVYKPVVEGDDAFGKAAEAVILGLGETSEPVVIQAHPAHFVEGRIATATGDGCGEGSLSLTDKARGFHRYFPSEADGTVRARGLLPATYTVEASCTGFVPAESYAPVTVAETSVSGLKWEVAAGQAIRGVVVDPRGGPVERVQLSARPKIDPANPRARTTTAWDGQSDAAGKFELAGLLPGVYELTFSPWNSPRPVPPKPVEVTLEAGRDLEGVRIELPATGELRGRVRDEKGQPVAGASVALSGGVPDYQSTAAADDGTFVFPHLGAGDYRATARKGWNSLRAPGTGDDDVQGAKVTVEAGSTARVELVVESPRGELSGVVRAEGGPVADAFIEATRESESKTAGGGSAARDGRWASYWDDRPHLTDPDGRFTLTDLVPGKYTLRAHRKGGGEAILEHVELGSDVALEIAVPGRMAGTVGLRGRAGAPDEFKIKLEDRATGWERSDSFFRTGGAWSFAEVPAGKYVVQVTAGEGVEETVVELAAGEDRKGVRVELKPLVTVRGQLVGTDGAPVPGMRIMMNAGHAWNFDGGAANSQDNVSDESGRFELPRTPTGLVSVVIMPKSWSTTDGYGWTTLHARIPEGKDIVELPPTKLARQGVKEGEVAGSLGIKLQEDPPGTDPLDRKLVVAFIRPGGPAAKAGLAVGDQIVSVDGQDVTGVNVYLYNALTQVVAGKVVNLGLARGASVAVTAEKQP